MTPQEQEELDYEASSYPNEFAAAYDLSRRDLVADRREGSTEIAAVIAAGRFAVVATLPAFCRFTDALIGENSVLDSDYATREEAEVAVAALYERHGIDDITFTVTPAAPRPPVEEEPHVDEDPDALPF